MQAIGVMESIKAILPTLDELRSCRDVNLKNNYNDVEGYLDFQFSLLRKDLISPLRKLVHSSIECKDASNVHHIFKNVRIVGLSDGQKHKLKPPCYCLQIQTNYEQTESKRGLKLMNNSLIVLLSQDCNKMIYAIITDTTDVQCGQIGVDFLDNIGNIYEFRDEKFTMIHSQSYLEAYIHGLKLLKTPDAKKFKFQDFILGSNKGEPRNYNFTGLQNLDISRIMANGETRVLNCNGKNWPPCKDTIFYEDQYKAFEKSLTNDFSIIQGPPGTGKSFLGIQICNVLLPFCKKKKVKLFIISTTNNAVDRFAEKLLDSNNNDLELLRIGGCSSNEKLKKHALFNRERLDKFSISEKVQTIASQLDHTKKKFITATKDLKKLLSCKNKGVLVDTRLIKRYNNDTGSLPILRNNEELHKWLGVSHTELKPLETLDCHYPGGYVLHDEITEFNRSNSIKIDEPVDMLDDSIDDDIEHEKENKTETEESVEQTERRQKVLDSYTGAEDITGNDNYKKNKRNIGMLSEESEKWSTYKYWVKTADHEITSQLVGLKNKMDGLWLQRKAIQFDYLKKDVARSDIIISTITGAAKYYDILKGLGSCILIAEEAADAMEANFIPCLLHDVKKFILIGDHLQLGPCISVKELAYKYITNISIFKRFEKNDLIFHRLSSQRRMAPQIYKLLNPEYKVPEEIQSNGIATTIRGIKKACLFINLDATEEDLTDNATTSQSNREEAHFACALCKYILQQGYNQEDVTILTPYTDQEELIRTMLTNMNLSVKVSTVDRFKGEENKIVILSLVRTTRPGFLTDNGRIRIMLTRAKEGFYVIGNFSIFGNQKKSLWKEVLMNAKDQGVMHNGIELICENHDQETRIMKPEEFEEKCPDGGCNKLCDEKLKCDHECQRKCHPDDKDHVDAKCERKCDGKMDCGHDCTKQCHSVEEGHSDKSSCQERVTEMKRPYCEHTTNVQCRVATNSDKMKRNEEVHRCTIHVSNTFYDCGHQYNNIKCFKIKNLKCENKCDTTLHCGHKCQGTCSKCKNGRLHARCTNGCSHKDQSQCSQECNPCRINVEHTDVENKKRTDYCLQEIKKSQLRIDCLRERRKSRSERDLSLRWITLLCEDLNGILTKFQPSEIQIQQISLEIERINVAILLEQTKSTMEETMSDALKRSRENHLKVLKSNKLLTQTEIERIQHQFVAPETPPIERTTDEDIFNNNDSIIIKCSQPPFNFYNVSETKTHCPGCNQLVTSGGHKLLRHPLT